MVFTCAGCGPLQHSCSMYQKVGEDELFAFRNLDQGNSLHHKWLTEPPRKDYLPISTANNWYEYYVNISGRYLMANCMSENFRFLSSFMSPDGLELIKTHKLAMRNATKIQTMPITVLAAMEEAIPDLPQRDELTLHFVGADWREVHQGAGFEELLHLLPSLKKLNLAMIGPDVPKSPLKIIQFDCCDSCKYDGRQIKIEQHITLYHKYAKLQQFKKPDMAILFNSYHMTTDKWSWRPTTAYLVNSSTLTLATTINRNVMIKEKEELMRMVRVLNKQF